METKKHATASGFTFWQDWDDYDGMLSWEGARTLDKYRELKDGFNSRKDLKAYDMFAAFNDSQFEKGMASIRPLREGEKLVTIGMGVYGTRDGVDRYMQDCRAMNRRIAEECDPQEIYCMEYNDHESMISWEGDREAVLAVAGLFGWEACKRLTRFSACHTLTELKGGGE